MAFRTAVGISWSRNILKTEQPWHLQTVDLAKLSRNQRGKKILNLGYAFEIHK
jgi:hypothetical protein